MNVESNRLTVAEYRAMDARLSATVDMWHANGQTRIEQSDTAILERIARHAIGCSDADLRDVELGLIAQQVEAFTDANTRARCTR